MRKEAPNTGVFVSRSLVKKVKGLAFDRGRKLGETVDLMARRLAEQVERGERLSLVVPESKKETRKDTSMLLVDKELTKRLRIIAAMRDVTVRALVRLAIEEGIEAEGHQPGSVVPQATKKTISTRPVHHDLALVEALKSIAAARGTTVAGLTDAVLRVVVQSPQVLDAIDLPPGREVPASASVEAAAKRVVDMASRPRQSSGKGSRRGGKRGRGRDSAR